MTDRKAIQDFQRGMAIIYFAMMAGQVLFLFLSLALVTTGKVQTDPELRNLFLIMVPLFVLFGFLVGNLTGRRLLMQAREAGAQEEKLNNYRTSMLMRYACLEAPSLLAIVAFLLTGERMFLGFTGMILFYFVSLFPSEMRIINDLELPEK